MENQAIQALTKEFTDRAARAEKLVAKAIKAEGAVFVPGSKSGLFYKVVLGHAPSCTCPDWIFRGRASGIPCKHMIAARAALNLLNQEVKAN